MTRIIGVPGPLPGGGIGFGVNAPPPGGTPGTGCTCSSLGVVWFNSSDFATVFDTDDAFPAFGITGSICSDTTYTITPSWAPDVGGASPIIVQFGASAWAVHPPVDGEPYDDGVLTVSVTAICAGQTFTLGPIFLTIIAGAYYTPTCSDPPTEYTNVLALSDCVTPVFNGDFTIPAADFYSDDGDGFTVFRSGFPNVPLYQGTPHDGVWLTFDGLAELFVGHSMDVRITILSPSIADGAYTIFIDNESFGTMAAFPGAWERTVSNPADFFTGMGVGDGAGGSGFCEIRIEVRVTPP